MFVHWSVGFILFYSSSCVIIKLGLLELLPSPVRDWPIQFLLPPEPSCASPCICSSSGAGRGLRAQLLGWGEKSPLPQWCVWPYSFSSLCLDMFFVSVSCEHENNWKSRDKSLEQDELSPQWTLVGQVCGHLPLSRWPKGVCMEGTPIFIGVLNVVVTLFIQSS